MRDAYDVRVSIVHGATPGEDSLRTLEGKVSIEKFVDRIEELLRIALKKMLQLQRDPRTWPPDWNRLIFG